jgi:glucose-1-phosphate adenylyltransferase
MDYSKLIAYHKKNNADCTIAVIDVPLSEASRMGIMSTDEHQQIYKFEEKPKNPDSTKASMGIYVFSKEKLFKYLKEDAADPLSDNDFGKNIIPKMLASGERMFAYPFSGYWKDVGTIDSLWQSNMDILGENPALLLSDESWKIFSRHDAESPQYISNTAKISNSAITEGSEIYGTVINSVIGGGVIIMEGAVVKDSVIMDNTVIGKNSTVEYSIIDMNVNIGDNVKIGEPRSADAKIAVIGADSKIKSGEIIEGGKMISVSM